MLDTKKMIQDGFKKVPVTLVVTTDRNGKEHVVVVDTLENAKKYSGSEEKRQATLYIKI